MLDIYIGVYLGAHIQFVSNSTVFSKVVMGASYELRLGSSLASCVETHREDAGRPYFGWRDISEINSNLEPTGIIADLGVRQFDIELLTGSNCDGLHVGTDGVIYGWIDGWMDGWMGVGNQTWLLLIAAKFD